MSKRILDYLKANKWQTFELNLVFVECADADLKPVPLVIDEWQDRVLLIKADGTVLANVAGTTKSGAYYTYNPMSMPGAARLALGQHLDCWAPGQHFSQHVFTQTEEIVISRDVNQNGRRDGSEPVQRGWWGTNFHTTGNNADTPGPTRIGKWSAGCLVVREPADMYNVIKPTIMSYIGRAGGVSKQAGRLTGTIIDAAAYQGWRQKWG